MLSSSETKVEVRLSCIVTYGQTGKQGMDGKPLSGFGNYWKSAQRCWDLFITFSPDYFFSFQIYLSMFIYLLNFFSAFYWILRRKIRLWLACTLVGPLDGVRLTHAAYSIPMARDDRLFPVVLCVRLSLPCAPSHRKAPLFTSQGLCGSLTGKITEQGMPRVQRRH